MGSKKESAICLSYQTHSYSSVQAGEGEGQPVTVREETESENDSDFEVVPGMKGKNLIGTVNQWLYITVRYCHVHSSISR